MSNQNTEIRFYHLQSQTLEQALPLLLTKAINKGNIIIKTHKSCVERLNEHLWSYRPDSFLPHGTAKDGNSEQQPIYITDQDENPNQAKILILTHASTTENYSDYDLCCEMLNGQNSEEVQAGRSRWKEYKEQGFNISYWQQTETGGWDQKA